jgi:hypothetical protein
MRPAARRPRPRELPGEIKVVMGFLILYGVLSFFGLVTALQGRSGSARAALFPAAFLALNAALFAGLLLRTVWGWWASTITFFFAQELLRSFLAVDLSSARELVSLGRLGTVGGIIFAGLFAVPLWLLFRNRRRYLASRLPPPPAGSGF